jgi:small subunit ribosomal protein S16
MVKIRLRREGAKDRPYYHIVVADARARREGAIIESIGKYDPMQEGKDNYSLDLEAAEKWISKGAQPSETVASLIKRSRKAKGNDE